MAEYVPTTDDVREAYRGIILATDKPEVFELIDPDQADSEFDRWLEGVGKADRLAERERIIALLEAGMKDNPPVGGIAIAIALIKGENK